MVDKELLSRRRGGKGAPRGSGNPMSKLTDDEVFEIVYAYKDEYTVASIARAFGITATAVRNILKGEAWGWLTGISPESPVLGHPERVVMP